MDVYVSLLSGPCAELLKPDSSAGIHFRQMTVAMFCWNTGQQSYYALDCSDDGWVGRW